MKKNAIRSTMFLCGVLFSLYGFAAAVIETATGTVRVGASAATAAVVSQGHRLEAGSTVVTGPKSQAILRFDDGQVMVLNEQTEFRVAEYSFIKDQPGKDRFSFELLRGALRSITALVTQRTPKAYQVRTAQATIGIRGTDYMLAVVNPLYFSVLVGTIEVANAAGAATFTAGTGFVANANALASTLAPGSLPGPVSTAFSNLASIPIAPPGAAGATGAAAGGVSPAAIAVGAAVAAGIAIGASGGGSDTPQTSTATGTR